MSLKYNHVLISATYASEKPVPSRDVSARIKRLVIPSSDTQYLLNLVTYQMPYNISPNQIGLREAWNNLSDIQKRTLMIQFPQLTVALRFMMGDVANEAQSLSEIGDDVVGES